MLPSGSTRTATSTAFACPPQAISDRVSRRAASRSARTSSGTSESRGPSSRRCGSKPSGTVASRVVSTSAVRSPDSSSWSEKMVRRTSWMVSSSWATKPPMVSACSGSSLFRSPSRPSPTANRRWITRSCNPRAMRSRSSRTARRSHLGRPGEHQRDSGMCGERLRQFEISFGEQRVAAEPDQHEHAEHVRRRRERHRHRGVQIGDLGREPHRRVVRPGEYVVAILPEDRRFPGDEHVPRSGFEIGTDSPLIRSAPIPTPSTTSNTRFPGRSSSGSAIAATGASASCRARSATSRKEAFGSLPDSKEPVMSLEARTHRALRSPDPPASPSPAVRAFLLSAAR